MAVCAETMEREAGSKGYKNTMGPKCRLSVFLIAFAAQQASAQRPFPIPSPERAVTITAIPGVIAAGATWDRVWQGAENADGLMAYKGGILFAQEQSNHINRIDEKGKFSIVVSANGPGSVAIGPPQDRMLALERTCTDPGGQPDLCKEGPDIAVVAPGFRQILTNGMDGKSYGRLNDIVADKKGGFYYTDGPRPDGAVFYYGPDRRVYKLAEKISANGLILGRDEKTLYVTNGSSIVSLEMPKGGGTTILREFAKLNGGADGDGMAIDGEGRIYVATAAGVQVFSPDGKFLGLIPTPRDAVSIAFSGPGKKVLYASCTGALGADGKEMTTRPGLRNTAMTIYKIQMEAEGFHGRPK